MMSNNRNKKGGKKQIQRLLFKPRPRPKPGWDDSINDLSVHKLSKEDMDARKKSLVSNHYDRARSEPHDKRSQPPQQFPTFFHHLDAQIHHLIRERADDREGGEDEEEEYYNEEEDYYSQPALPSTSRFSVVPEVTLAPNSRNSEVRGTPHPNRIRSSSARGWEEDKKNRRGEYGGDGEDPLVTPVQPPRRELRPTPLPSGTPSPLNYNMPKIDPDNVMRYQDSIHMGSGIDDVADDPVYKQPIHLQKQSNGNSSNGRPSSAGGVRAAQGYTIDLEEEIKNFKKQNNNNRPNSRNRSRPNSANGMHVDPNILNNIKSNPTNNTKMHKKNTASKPPLRPQHDTSTHNTSNDNLANLNGSLTNNLSNNLSNNHPSFAEKYTNISNHLPNNYTNHVEKRNRVHKSTNDSLDAVGRELDDQVNNLARMQVNNSGVQDEDTFTQQPSSNELASSTRFVLDSEEQRREDAKQKAVLWEAIQNQINKITALEQTVNTLQQEKEELHRHFLAFQQLTSEKFLLVQQVLAQYVRSAELDKLGLPITSQLPPSSPQPSSHQPHLPHQSNPSQQPNQTNHSNIPHQNNLPQQLHLPQQSKPQQSHPQQPNMSQQSYPQQSNLLQQPQQQHPNNKQAQQHIPHHLPQQSHSQQLSHPQEPPRTLSHASQPVTSSHQATQLHTFPHPTTQPLPPQPTQQDEDYYTFFQKPQKPSPTTQHPQPSPSAPPAHPAPSHSRHPPYPTFPETRDTSEYNEYSKALLERQRKYLSSPREAATNNYQNQPLASVPSQKGNYAQAGIGSVVKDVEVVEGPRKLPPSLRAQNFPPTLPYQM